MTQDKTIVCISASFENKEQLFQNLKKYAQISDKRFACWDEFAFTTELLSECDALLVFNTPFEKIRTKCYAEKLVAFMMEPGDKDRHPWMFKGLHQYASVYSPVKNSGNTILSHGYLGWYFRQDYHFLAHLAVPSKTKMISCIASNLVQLQGHRDRVNFINELKQNCPQINFYGKGDLFLSDKMDGLLPYKYSIAIENSSTDNYFTEKINDCFLSYTVPVYFGCTNIDKYFPAKSFITINIKDRPAALKKINWIIQNDDWVERLPYVMEARELVLKKYQPLAGAASIFRNLQASEKKMIVLKPVQPGIFKKLKKTVARFLNKTG